MHDSYSPNEASKTVRDWVLVVDDDAPVRQLIRDQLHGADVDVVEAPGAVAALQTLDQHPTAPLLAVIDVLMPGMDGLTLARKLAARLGGRTKLAIISGHMNDASWWPVELREVTFITKPFRMAAIMELVRDARSERGDQR